MRLSGLSDGSDPLAGHQVLDGLAFNEAYLGNLATGLVPFRANAVFQAVLEIVVESLLTCGIPSFGVALHQVFVEIRDKPFLSILVPGCLQTVSQVFLKGNR